MRSDELRGDDGTDTPRQPRRRRRDSEAEQLALLQRDRDAELLDRIRAAQLGDSSATAPNGRRTHADGPAAAPGSLPGTTPRPCPEYEVLANRLFDHAVPLFKYLLRTGLITGRLLDLRLPVGLTSDDYERLRTSMVARDALAINLVIAGEEYFRRTIIPKRSGLPAAGRAWRRSS
jgi:hypothetical protein